MNLCYIYHIIYTLTINNISYYLPHLGVIPPFFETSPHSHLKTATNETDVSSGRLRGDLQQLVALVEEGAIGVTPHMLLSWSICSRGWFGWLLVPNHAQKTKLKGNKHINLLPADVARIVLILFSGLHWALHGHGSDLLTKKGRAFPGFPIKNSDLEESVFRQNSLIFDIFDTFNMVSIPPHAETKWQTCPLNRCDRMFQWLHLAQCARRRSRPYHALPDPCPLRKANVDLVVYKYNNNTVVYNSI